ncbi:MAG: DUF2914 domain-containing protein [Candidatus Eisenbacteria bacterium]|nr:DUF2914 domain-containing protein [Candidatus Eisenbacteria bacterium]
MRTLRWKPLALATLAAVIVVAATPPAGAQSQEADADIPDSTSSAGNDTTRAHTSEAQGDTAAAPSGRSRSPEKDVAESGGSEFEVLRAYICRGIDQSEPTEAGKSFIPAPDGVLQLWCFSEIGGPARRDTVLHVWYWGEREMASVALEVKGPRWRTWSTKQILDEWSGEWRVDITDHAGNLLSSLGFSVEQPRE